MWKNYLKIGLRNLYKNKIYTAINVLGLAVGMACCLMIFLFVNDELNYDKFQKHYQRIYRIIYHSTNGYDFARVPPPIQPLLKNNFPAIETSARVFSRSISVSINYEGKNSDYEEEDVLFADSAINKILSLKVLQGNPQNFFKEPYTVVLSKSTATKYFGTESAYGKSINIIGNIPVKVVGVVSDYPSQSHLQFSMIMPYDDMFKIEQDDMENVMRDNLAQNWVISHSYTYVLLKEGFEPETVNAEFAEFVKNNAPEQLQVGQTFSLEPMKKWHLNSEAVALFKPNSDIGFIHTFSAIALITLIIACFNFINLSTAYSSKRTREVGLRKIMGAKKYQLFTQFLGEAIIISLFAFILALLLVSLALPQLNLIANKTLQLSMAVIGVSGFFVFIGLFLITGILGGSYPSFVLSQIKVVNSIKGKTSSNVHGGFNLRKVLVTIQFTMSIALIAGAIFIYNQISFIQNKSMGFNSEQMVIVPVLSENFNSVFGGVNKQMYQRLTTFEEEISKNPAIQASTLSSQLPGMGSVSRMVTWQGKPDDKPEFISSMAVDYDFLDTYGLKVIAGRGFNENSGTDADAAYVVNETLVKEFGWKNSGNALGKEIDLEKKIGKVIGVVKDFHFNSMREPIRPLIIEIRPVFFNAMSILVSGDFNENIQYLENKWKKHFPEKAFDYYFLDESLQNQYESDRSLARIVAIFAIIAIVVSVMGSYGLIMYSAKSREKELGVRKVLGASAPLLLRLLAAEFTYLFVIGFVLAVPLAFYFTGTWLNNFVYRIQMDWWVFALSGAIALLLIWISIGYQSIKAALVNPVDMLRDE
jgi:putative ABC transport system permease protein